MFVIVRALFERGSCFAGHPRRCRRCSSTLKFCFFFLTLFISAISTDRLLLRRLPACLPVCLCVAHANCGGALFSCLLF